MQPGVLLVCAASIVALMFIIWVLSIVRRDASIVDIIWGAGFVMVGWVAHAAGHGTASRSWLLAVCTSVWGLRLTAHLAWRNHGKGEDFRYRAMRKHYGARFGIVSLFVVFGLQGLLMWVVSLPIQLGQIDPHPRRLGAITWIGLAVWAVGLTFEVVGDSQLARFKADPASRGLVMDKGLWSWTRHPNYFGDCCVWWGLYLIAADTALGRLAIIGPIVMTVLLVRVSGVAMLERTIARRRPGYTAYIARTSAFLPRPPRRG